MSAPAAAHDPDVSSGSVGAAGPDGQVASPAGTVSGAAAVPGPVATAAAWPGREARRTSRTHRRAADVVTTVLLLVLLAVESVAAAGGIVFLSMAFHSCAAPGNTCDAGLGGGVVTVGPVLVVLVFLGTVVGCVLRLVRRRFAWPLALVGIAAQVVVFLAALLLVDAAVQHGF